MFSINFITMHTLVLHAVHFYYSHNSAVQKHLKFVDLLMLKESNDTYRVQFVYDMGPTFRGYAALMTERYVRLISYIYNYYAFHFTG